MTAAPSTSATAAPAGPRNALPEFLHLRRSGGLVEHYPAVAGLLRRMSAADLAIAGRLLSRLPAAEIARRHPAVPGVRVHIAGHGTLSMLVPALVAQTARHGLLATVELGGYDGYIFELSDTGSALYAAEPDLTVCVLDAQTVFDEVPVPWRPEDVQRVFAEKLALLDRLVGTFTAHGRGTLVLNTLPLPRQYQAQLIDHASRALLGRIWREGNAALLRLADRPGVVAVDLDPWVAEGIPVLDPRLSAYAKAHLSPELLAAHAREIGHLARNLTGRTAKCLALDLDGTVWGGVLGDDGADGIELADTPRGEAFYAFQKTAKQLASQGVLLAAVSKNDPEPVREVLRDHPRQVLREADFVRVSANWRPKHENLGELARALNLGLDSFVFVDDSPYERGLIERELPQVAVVALDDEPALHAARLLADGWFDTPVLTEEDRSRTAAYAGELAREDFLRGFDSLTDYLAELGVRVQVAPASEADVPRVAQLTQRTNQFNLTARRLQTADVAAMADDPGRAVLVIRSADRFGDNGLVGAVFTRREGEDLHVDNFVLSCRVFSRGVEQASLSAVLGHARRTGAVRVLATYRPTAKNGGVRDLYPRYGFAPTGSLPESGVLTFSHDLAAIPAPPAHIDLLDLLGAPGPGGRPA